MKMDHNSDWSNFFKCTAVLKGASPSVFTVCVCTLSLCWEASAAFGDSMLMRSLVWRSGTFMHSPLTVQNPNPGWNAPSEFKTCDGSWAWQLSLPGLTCKASYSVVARGYLTSHILGSLRLLSLWIFSALLLTCVPVSQPPQHSPTTSETVKCLCWNMNAN